MKREKFADALNSGRLQWVVLGWWCKSQLGFGSPPPFPARPTSPLLILSPLNNPPTPPPPPLNWHGTHQVRDQAGDSEVAPRLGLFTRAVALQRLWYFCFQMPGMEKHVLGNTKSLLSPTLRTLFFLFLQSRKTRHTDTDFVCLLIKNKLLCFWKCIRYSKKVLTFGAARWFLENGSDEDSFLLLYE